MASHWRKATSGWGKVLKDKSVVKTPLRIAGKTYPTGFGTHAQSVIAFDISGEGFTRFTATVGADQSATDDPEGWADLEFLVYGSGENRKRAGLRNLDRLMRTLGRPKRDVVVTRRESYATTAQLIELSNGKPLADLMARGGKAWKESGHSTAEIVDALFVNALGRSASDGERQTAREVVGSPTSAQGIKNLFWILTIHPEFQLIH